MHALSLKQPWAALLVHGLKTIEIRRWRTTRRGRILIHAAKEPDERPEAWQLVPPELREVAELMGGILGAGDLTDCKAYNNLAAFAADQVAHLNHPSWFDGPVMHGFTFINTAALPFRPCPGWMRFFAVPEEELANPPPLRSRVPSLMVSVRSAEEAELALAGGAALIDVKEPERGALGQAPHATIQAVARKVAGRRPVSAALGELLEGNVPPENVQLDYAKWGLAGCGGYPDWPGKWRAAAEHLQHSAPRCRPVVVAYADWQRAQAPFPEVLCTFARLSHCGGFLLDTWQKDGSTLLDWLSPDAVARLCRNCLEAGIPVALAGSLGPEEIVTLRPAKPDWFAVRGSVCQGRRREGAIDPDAVRRLVDLVAGFDLTAARSGS